MGAVSTKVVKWDADLFFAPQNTSAFFNPETLEKWKTLMPGRLARIAGPLCG